MPLRALQEPTIADLRKLRSSVTRAEFHLGDKLLFACDSPELEDISTRIRRAIGEVAAIGFELDSAIAQRTRLVPMVPALESEPTPPLTPSIDALAPLGVFGLEFTPRPLAHDLAELKDAFCTGGR